jgi:hypothetical protein
MLMTWRRKRLSGSPVRRHETSQLDEYTMTNPNSTMKLTVINNHGSNPESRKRRAKERLFNFGVGIVASLTALQPIP